MHRSDHWIEFGGYLTGGTRRDNYCQKRHFFTACGASSLHGRVIFPWCQTGCMMHAYRGTGVLLYSTAFAAVHDAGSDNRLAWTAEEE